MDIMEYKRVAMQQMDALERTINSKTQEVFQLRARVRELEGQNECLQDIVRGLKPVAEWQREYPETPERSP